MVAWGDMKEESLWTCIVTGIEAVYLYLGVWTAQSKAVEGGSAGGLDHGFTGTCPWQAKPHASTRLCCPSFLIPPSKCILPNKWEGATLG